MAKTTVPDCWIDSAKPLLTTGSARKREQSEIDWSRNYQPRPSKLSCRPCYGRSSRGLVSTSQTKRLQWGTSRKFALRTNLRSAVPANICKPYPAKREGQVSNGTPFAIKYQ